MRQLSLRRRLRERFPLSHCLVLPAPVLLCCAIPKNACTAVKHWMLWAAGIDTSHLNHGEVHEFARDRLGIERISRRDMRRLRESAFTFAVVRDPVDRVASAYIDKFIRQDPMNLHAKGVVEAARFGTRVRLTARERFEAGGRWVEERSDPRIDYRAGVSFAEFVAYLESTPNERLDAHYRPQADFLRLSGFRFQQLMAFTRFREGLAEVASQHGINVWIPEAPPPEPRLDASLHLANLRSGEIRAMGALPSPESLLTEDLRTRLQRRYEPDLNLR